MRRQILAACFVLALVTVLGCGSGTDEGAGSETAAGATQDVKKAIAWILPKGDNKDMGGSAIFIKAGSQVDLQVAVQQAPAGTHAVHIHENGDCSAPDATSAGGHWNPTSEDHGEWDVAPHHLGDIGNLEVGEDGEGSVSLSTDKWSMGTGADNDILGKAVIVHAGADDFTSQPTGAAGGRIGCGVIKAQ